MTTPAWQPGTLYQPGAFVVPRSKLPVQTGVITNPNFAAGNTGWAVAAGATITAGTPFLPGSTHLLSYTGTGVTVNNAQYAVAPGQLINGQCYVWVGTNSSDSGDVRIRFYDASHTFLSDIAGGTKQGTGNSWQKITVAAVAPAGAAFAAIACAGSASGGNHVLFSNFTWDYTYNTPADSLTYEAVQADAATSAANEPIWPLVAGVTVVDGGVTWEAVTYSQIVWTASSIMTSGGSEPTWPTQIGGAIADNTISWVATSRQITDPNCPNTKVALIGSSHVFAIDDDIDDFCAATNPLDWTTQGDAGFLPTGLQQYGDNPNAAMGLYRGNLVAFNSGGYQMWQIDPDPENMAILDAEPIGCTAPKSVQAVVNDLLFLTPLGIRSVGISGASANLQAGNVGNQIDDLVVAAIAAMPANNNPGEAIGLYYPARGQYWLIFDNGDGTSTAFVMTVYSVTTAQMTAYNTTSQSWSRYVFPEVITDWTLLGDDLYLRTASDLVWKVDPAQTLDDSAPAADVAALWPLNTLNDSSAYGNTLTLVGTAVIDGTEKQFGLDTLDMTSDDFTIGAVTPLSAKVRLLMTSTADWTVQGWIRPNFDGEHGLLNIGQGQTGGAAGDGIIINTDGVRLHIDASTAMGGTGISGGAPTLNYGQWNHFAVVRHSNVVTAYLNGIVSGTPSTNWGTAAPVAGSPYVHIGGTISGAWGTSYMAQVEIDNFAAYTAAFTPPTAPADITTGFGFVGMIQWPWLDMNSISVEKNIVGFDAVLNGVCAVDFGYDQTNPASFTDPYEISGDTLTGQPIPYPVRGPSFSMRMIFDADQQWEWQASILYIDDDKGAK